MKNLKVYFLKWPNQDDRHRMIVNEMGCHAMSITNVKLEDAGVFGCLAKNGSGEAGFQVIINTL